MDSVDGGVQHRQVAALIDRDLAELTVMEAPGKGSSLFRATPDARGRHETASVTSPPRLIQPLPPTLPESRVSLSHALLTIDCALPGGDGSALLFAGLTHDLDDRLDDRGSNKGDDQNVVGMISDRPHDSLLPDQQKAPSS